MSTCSDDETGVEIDVSTSSHRPGPRATLVQIDTSRAGRLRVMLNDACLWDGDPERDERPGEYEDRLDPKYGDLVHVSEEAARHVLDYFEGGPDVGHFLSALFTTILAADNENLRKLAEGHREYVQGVLLWKGDKEKLREFSRAEVRHGDSG